MMEKKKKKNLSIIIRCTSRSPDNRFNIVMCFSWLYNNGTSNGYNTLFSREREREMNRF